MKESFRNTYIAIPVNESPLLEWVRSINKHKKFFHLTMYFLGEINEKQLESVISAMKTDPNKLSGSTMKPKSLEYIGPSKSTFVVRLEDDQKLNEFREHLEKHLPKYSPINLPFLPHITINKSRDKVTFDMSGNVYQEVLNLPVKSVGVYYKTEEGATALLYNQKVY